MEVILKKSKITSSILKQCLRSSLVDLDKGEILGWAIFNKIKYIVCYRSDSCSLTIYQMFNDVEEIPQYKDNKANKTYLIKVRLGGNYVPLTYTCDSEDNKDKVIAILKKAKHQAQTKGQFFI